MRPLIDGDVLTYEAAFCGQIMEEDEDGNKSLKILDFDVVQEVIENRIRIICEEVGATAPPLIFLTGDRYLHEKHLGIEYVPNFRIDLACTRPYKGNRKQEKPWHFLNAREHLLGAYECKISVGTEADDDIIVYSHQEADTVICSRDKDLRMSHGWHYSWECGKQAAVGPILVTDFGWLEKKKDKVLGFGPKFFYYQLVTGDNVDNIPGRPKIGSVKAFNMLEGVTTEEEAYALVRASYEELGGNWKNYLKEQAALLWVGAYINKGVVMTFNPKRRGLV